MHSVSRNSKLNKPGFLRRLIGVRDEFSLENRVYNAASLISIVICLMALLWNSSIGIPMALNVLFGGLMIVYFVLYYIARFKKRFNSILFVIISCLGLSAIWFGTEGVHGSTPIIYILAIGVFVTLSKSKHHYKILIITLLNIGALVLIDFYYHEWIIDYQNQLSKDLDLYYSLFFTFLIMFIFLSLFKKDFDKDHQLIVEQSKRLETLNATKDKLFSIIAHDMRSAFSGSLGLSELLTNREMEIEKEKLYEISNALRSSLHNSFKLLDNLLEWANFQQGLTTCNKVNANLKELIQNSLEPFLEAAQSKRIQFDVSESTNIDVQTDLFMTETIIRNLVSNAIKFSHMDSTIYFNSTVMDRFIETTVTDSGIGIPKDLQENLFVIKGDTGRSGTSGEPSTGLGLILCKDFITELGGEIYVDSKEGKGSLFSFLIPTS